MAVSTTGQEWNLTDKQFAQISELVHRLAGINLHDGKRQLVKARLSRRMRVLSLTRFNDYLDHLESDTSGAELTSMLDAISTNLTYFFRESHHFHYLQETLLPTLEKQKTDRKIRIWSAGCSSGEEPYTLSVMLHETIKDLARWDAAILATDLSTKVLAIARRGEYGPERFRESPEWVRRKYFQKQRTGSGDVYVPNPEVRRLITFARLNLMESWPMKGPFDFIFCRNVMIYFDKATQEQLVNRYWELLPPGGLLFLGHSESLTGVNHKFRYVQPAIYRK
ncbi:MAG: CheR family methyltransferase [Phycisphaerae bacterium]